MAALLSVLKSVSRFQKYQVHTGADAEIGPVASFTPSAARKLASTVKSSSVVCRLEPSSPQRGNLLKTNRRMILPDLVWAAPRETKFIPVRPHRSDLFRHVQPEFIQQARPSAVMHALDGHNAPRTGRSGTVGRRPTHRLFSNPCDGHPSALRLQPCRSGASHINTSSDGAPRIQKYRPVLAAGTRHR